MFEVRSLPPLTLGETFTQPCFTKRCLKNLNYNGIKKAPSRSFGPCGSNFSLKIQEKQRFFHKCDKCRICMVDKFGIYHGGGGWIRTTVGIASRFTVCPLWPLGNTPILTLRGAGGRIRTPDLLITNQLLYQLSYTSRITSKG